MLQRRDWRAAVTLWPPSEGTGDHAWDPPPALSRADVFLVADSKIPSELLTLPVGHAPSAAGALTAPTVAACTCTCKRWRIPFKTVSLMPAVSHTHRRGLRRGSVVSTLPSALQGVY